MILAAIIGMLPMFDYESYYEGNDFSKDGPGEYKKIVGFSYNVRGFGPNYMYSVQRSEENENVYVLECEDYENGIRDVSGEIDDEVLLNLSELCADLNVLSWDKFDMVAKDVLDGEGFDLSIDFEDGTRIRANGDNAFPKNYSEFKKRVVEIFEPSVKEIMVNTQDGM